MGTVDLNVVDAGKPDGQPVVLIHGFMSSRHQWDLNLERLGAELRTVLVELPGHGDSPAPADPASYAPPSVLGAIDEIRQRLDIERWWVVGHSMGGAVGIRYALAHPGRTRGLVFTNSRAVFGIQRPADGPPEPLRPRSVEDLRRLPFHPVHAKRFPAELRERMMAMADAMDPSAVTNLGASAAAWRSRDELGQLQVPALLVNGTWEKSFQPHVPDAQATIPDLRIARLEGGHSINIEQPEAFDRAVLDFVAEVDGRP